MRADRAFKHPSINVCAAPRVIPPNHLNSAQQLNYSYPSSLGVLRGVVFVISCSSCLTTCRIWGGILAGVVSLPRFPLELLCSGCPTEFPRADCVVLSPRKVKYKCRVGGWKQNDMEKQVACGLRISSWISYQWAIT